MARRALIIAALLSTTACMSSTMRIDQTIPTTFQDLASLKAIEVTTQSGDVLLSGTFQEAAAPATGKFERTATLTSPRNSGTKGSAAIEIDRTSGLSEEELVVKLDQMPYPESCRLVADGRELTIFSTIEKGTLEFRLSRKVTFANGKLP